TLPAARTSKRLGFQACVPANGDGVGVFKTLVVRVAGVQAGPRSTRHSSTNGDPKDRATIERASMESSRLLFTPEQLERARRYHRPLYIALLVDTTLALLVLSLLVFSRAGSRLYAVLDELPWWGGALLFPILVLGVLTLLRLPLSFGRGHVRERRWGFSTQTAWDWLLDRVKGFAVAAVLTAVAVLAFVALARAVPAAWPAAAAPGAALLVLALAFAAPIVIEPLFNRLRP